MTSLKFTTYPDERSGFVWVAVYTSKTRPKHFLPFMPSSHIHEIERYDRRTATSIVRRLNALAKQRDTSSLLTSFDDIAGVLGLYDWLYEVPKQTNVGAQDWYRFGYGIIKQMTTRLSYAHDTVNSHNLVPLSDSDKMLARDAICRILNDIDDGQYTVAYPDRLSKGDTPCSK